MTHTEILKNISKSSLASTYFLHGEEPFFIQQIADKIQDLAIPVPEKSFNEFLLFGKDLSVGALLNYARRFPMMAEKQLIVVKDAAQMQGLDQKDQQSLLEDYAINPLPSTILVLCFEKAQDERKTWVKSFGKKGILLNSKKLYDNQLPEFISSICHAKGTKISMKAIQMLVENIGNDLKRISNEVDKIILNLQLGEEINAGVVERFVGISKEYNVFELQKALLQRDILKANQIVAYFSANPKDNPIQPILIILYNFFTKILLVHTLSDKSENGVATSLGVNRFFVKDYLQGVRQYSADKLFRIVHSLRQADARSKGIVGTYSEDQILKELVFSILH